VQVGGFEAGCRADDAADVGGSAADPADDMVVVVADAPFVAGGTARRLDPAEEVRRREGPQRVVHRLSGDATKLVRDGAGNRLDIGVGPHPDLFEDGEAYRRDAAARGAQELNVILGDHYTGR